MSVARFNPGAIRVLNVIEFQVLSQESLFPPKSIAEQSEPFNVYNSLLLHVATKYAAQAPMKWADSAVEHDYLAMRVRVFHQLDQTSLKRTAGVTDAECTRKARILEQFVNRMKQSAKL